MVRRLFEPMAYYPTKNDPLSVIFDHQRVARAFLPALTVDSLHARGQECPRHTFQMCLA